MKRHGGRPPGPPPEEAHLYASPSVGSASAEALLAGDAPAASSGPVWVQVQGRLEDATLDGQPLVTPLSSRSGGRRQGRYIGTVAALLAPLCIVAIFGVVFVTLSSRRQPTDTRAHIRALQAPTEEVATGNSDFAPYMPPSATETQRVDAVTSYGVFLGRGAACGMPVEARARLVELWIRRAAQEPERQTPIRVLRVGGRFHFEQQMSGASPDTCDVVEREFRQVAWPGTLRPVVR